MPVPAEPPRLAEALVRLLLPPELEDAVAGDLAEEFAERARAGSRVSAALWYWGQLLRLRPIRLRRQLRRLGGAWSPGGRRAVRTTSSGFIEPTMETLKQTFRRLRREPGFATIAVLSLALGIGANTAVFSLVNVLFLQDRGIYEPERAVQIYRVGDSPYWSISWPWYREIRDGTTAFEAVSALRFVPVRIGDRDDVVSAVRVSGDYFGVMGVRPAMGRAFVPGEETDVERSSDVVILSHDYWLRFEGGSPAVLGREIRVNARPHTVVGVLPPDFQGSVSGVSAGVYLPDHGAVTSRADNLWGGGRLADGATLRQAETELAVVAAAINAGRPEGATPIEFNMVLESGVHVQPGLDEAIAPMAALLFGVVGLVLLIACTNLASFLLARASDRKKEFAVRMALGAGRGRVVRQLLTESTILSVAGGVCGVILSWWGLRLLLSVPPALPVSIDLDVSPDLRILAFTLVVSLLAGLFFGVFPALQASRSEVAPTLRDESGGTTGGRGTWNLRGVLVVAQVALSLVLLAGAGLFLRSLAQAATIDPGFDPEGLAMVTVDPATTGYEPAEWAPLYDRLLARARALPGVEAAAAGSRVPLQLGNYRTGVRRTDVEPEPGREYWFAQVVYAGEGYFEATGTEIRRGRPLGTPDPGGPVPVVMSRSLVDRLWNDPAFDPVGQPVRLSASEEGGLVVGVTETVHVNGLGDDEAMIYLPMARFEISPVLLLARGSGSEAARAEELRQLAKELDPDLYVHSAMSAERSAGLALFLPRMAAGLLASFGALALLMAAIGLYGVVGYTVRRREKEVGIRISLGADRGDVVRLMMKGGLVLVGTGVAAGLVVALAGGRLLERFLYGVSGTDPLTFAGIAVVLLGVAALAAWLPARRAARIEPLEALRSQ
jgi:predicted permease